MYHYDSTTALVFWLPLVFENHTERLEMFHALIYSCIYCTPLSFPHSGPLCVILSEAKDLRSIPAILAHLHRLKVVEYAV